MLALLTRWGGTVNHGPCVSGRKSPEAVPAASLSLSLAHSCLLSTRPASVPLEICIPNSINRTVCCHSPSPLSPSSLNSFLSEGFVEVTVGTPLSLLDCGWVGVKHRMRWAVGCTCAVRVSLQSTRTLHPWCWPSGASQLQHLTVICHQICWQAREFSLILYLQPSLNA